MEFVFSRRSINNFELVDKKLIILITYALATSEIDFVVTEGFRTLNRQKELYAQGRTTKGKQVTWTMRSKHLEGKAIDIYPYPVDFSNNPFYRYRQEYLRNHIKICAEKLNIPLRIIKKDLPHYELGG